MSKFIVVKYEFSAYGYLETVAGTYATIQEAVDKAKELRNGYLVVDEDNNLVYPLDLRLE